MGDIFQEVDEEVRRDQLGKLLKQYGGYLVAGALALVLGVAASVGWREYKAAQQREDSDQFTAAVALAADGRTKEAADVLQVVAREAGDGYALVARFREADLRMKAGDSAAALQIYEAIAADGDVGALYRDLARLLSVMHRIDQGDPEALRKELAPLLQDGNGWRHSARELSGALALRVGDRELAKTEFQRLADDLEAPPSARARAAEVLQALG